MANYYVEFAKSSRSKCKKCGEVIQKGEIRVVKEVAGEKFNTTASFHPGCFALPKKHKDIVDFIDAHLSDRTEGEILPVKKDELVASFTAALQKTHKAKADEDSKHPLNAIKAAYEAQVQDPEAEPPVKKQKVDSRAIELYGKFLKFKNPELGDLLQWNRQVKKGNKNAMLFKVIDGAMYGRLALCNLCHGGKLKIADDASKVVCSGRFDEEASVRIPCEFTSTLEDAPRWKWFDGAPTEDEEAEMDRQEEAVAGSADAAAANGGDVEQLQAAVKDLEYVLTSRDGMRKAAEEMVQILKNHPGKTLDLPDDAKSAFRKVGTIISGNKNLSATEIVPVLVKEFGFKQDKEEQAAKKVEVTMASCKVPENAAVIAAFSELSELYFKEGNANAGISYKKATAALRELDFAITEDNAKGLGKGKTKVANIGKSSADKIYEFMTTGSIAKLEEKRANAA